MNENSSFSDITPVPRKYNNDLQYQNDFLDEAEQDWLPVCNNQGFVYFYKKTSGECQYAFPKVYNPKTKGYSHLFMRDWVKVPLNQVKIDDDLREKSKFFITISKKTR